MTERAEATEAELRYRMLPPPSASVSRDARWCQPGDRPERRYVVMYEEAGLPVSVFEDWKKARDHYAKATHNWNCWLFAAVPVDDLGKDVPTGERPEPSAYVGDYGKSDGTHDYFVMLRVGDRELAFQKHAIRGRAEYGVAELKWLLWEGEKPDALSFDDTVPES